VERYNARAIGMGNIFTSIADDSTAVFYNPACVGQFSEKSFFNCMYADIHSLGIIRNYIFSGSTRYNEEIGMGGAWVYERINLEPEIWGQHRFFYALSYSVLKYVFIGTTVKFFLINTDFKEYKNVWGAGLNVGLLVSSERWEIPVFEENNIVLKIGLLLKDVYSEIKWSQTYKEKLPFRFILNIGGNYNKIINAGIQIKSLKDEITSFSIGSELFLLKALDYELDEKYKIKEIVIRAGIEMEKIISYASYYSGGIGIITQNFSIDYAILYQPNYFSPTHYISLNIWR